MHLHGGTWRSEPLGHDRTIFVYRAALHVPAVLIWSGRGRVLVAELGEVDVEFRVVRLGLDAEFVGGVLAEPFDVLGLVEDHRFSELRLEAPASSFTDRIRSG
ncbi:hypothetical protein HET69_29050 [Streptomyces sp. CJ_13]|uniref:hypothetical protein n=1 Tax=Streptomyces sp. CJ_13 TaxID=2724943 RepID=UPI001BDBFF3B|nr:hypothetical protein [Streptomyces sp. CJ_13]MBT1187921.1 hypothetical protein [Streptomyces sp. CJ_13]